MIHSLLNDQEDMHVSMHDGGRLFDDCTLLGVHDVQEHENMFDEDAYHTAQGAYGFTDSTNDDYGGNGTLAEDHHEHGLITAHSPRRTALPLCIEEEDDQPPAQHLSELAGDTTLLQPLTGSNDSQTTASAPKQRASSASSGAGDAYVPLYLDYDESMPPALFRARALARYREKKLRRCYSKRVRYAARKANADARPRINGRFVKRGQAVMCVA